MSVRAADMAAVNDDAADRLRRHVRVFRMRDGRSKACPR